VILFLENISHPVCNPPSPPVLGLGGEYSTMMAVITAGLKPAIRISRNPKSGPKIEKKMF
jgi:hypothetical protein